MKSIVGTVANEYRTGGTIRPVAAMYTHMPPAIDVTYLCTWYDLSNLTLSQFFIYKGYNILRVAVDRRHQLVLWWRHEALGQNKRVEVDLKNKML